MVFLHRKSLGYLAAVMTGLTWSACSPGHEDPNRSYGRPATAPEKPLATWITSLGDLHQPESIKYDAVQDVFFISNMVGFGSDKDRIGYIVRVDAGDLSNASVFSESGKNGVELDAPKGMTIQGDTLWVCDIDKIRALHRLTGLPIRVLDLAPLGAVLLNDITVGPDGALYVTDTGILMTPKGVIHTGDDRIFRIAGSTVSVFASGRVLGRPNGIVWDRDADRLVVASFDPFRSELYSIEPGGERRRLASGKGRFDGVEPLGGGYFMVAEWNDSSVKLVGNGTSRRIANNLMQPADIGFDTKRRRLAVPVGPLNQMQLWQLPDDITSR